MNAVRAAIVILALAAGGCTSFFRGADLAPSGLPRTQDSLRRLLASGRADSALGRLVSDDAAEGDPLLRTLQAAIAAVHAGEPDRATDLFAAADPILEERLTPSVSAHALSFVASDRSLPWVPSPTERLLIPWYAARARLDMGDTQGAAVEARRIAALLETTEDVPPSLAGALRVFNASVFEAVGERNDALVSWRHAAQLLPSMVDSTPAPDSVAELTVIVEQGFVAHRVPQSLNLVLASWESHGLIAGQATATGAIAARVLPEVGGVWVDRPGRSIHIAAPPCTGSHCRDDDDDDDVYLLRIAWPALRRSQSAGWHVPERVETGDGAECTTFALADVSAGVAADFEADRLGILTRAIARAAVKYALVRAAESEVSKKDDTAGDIMGIVANVGTALLEQADTRSWHLLPDRIVIARLQLPPGEHPLRLTFSDGSTADLGTVDVPPGRSFHTVRLW